MARGARPAFKFNLSRLRPVQGPPRSPHHHMGGDGSKEQEPPTPPPVEEAPARAANAPEPARERSPAKMSEPTAPPEGKEYPEFPGEKLSKRCATRRPTRSTAAPRRRRARDETPTADAIAPSPDDTHLPNARARSRTSARGRIVDGRSPERWRRRQRVHERARVSFRDRRARSLIVSHV